MIDYIIKRNKDGLNQEISEEGSNLSVGMIILLSLKLIGLKTILNHNKILTLDNGKIVDFNSTKNLYNILFYF